MILSTKVFANFAVLGLYLLKPVCITGLMSEITAVLLTLTLKNLGILKRFHIYWGWFHNLCWNVSLDHRWILVSRVILSVAVSNIKLLLLGIQMLVSILCELSKWHAILSVENLSLNRRRRSGSCINKVVIFHFLCDNILRWTSLCVTD